MKSFVFFGDFVCKNPNNISLGKKLKEWIKADYIACNFEAPISTNATPSPKSGPSLSQSADSPAFLEKHGFNIIQLANNHMMDYGQQGVNETINSFHTSLIIGAGCGDKVYEIKVVDCGSKKVGLLCLVQHEFGALDKFHNEGVVGTAWINHPQVNDIVRNARNCCDYLVILPHAGFEGIHAPLPEWRQRYKELLDLGADAIIASHPHVPQGWEKYKGKPIYYSLGNFCFDNLTSHSAPYWRNSIAVKMLLHDDGHVSFEEQNVLFDGSLLEVDKSNEIKEHNDYLCNLLSDDTLYDTYIENELDAFWDTYKLYMLRGLGAISLGTSFNTFIHAGYGVLKGEDIPMLINNFQCETHNWAIQNILRRKMKK